MSDLQTVRNVPCKISSENSPHLMEENTKLGSLDRLKKVSYAVTKNVDIFKYDSTCNKTMRIAYLIFSVILFPVGLIRLLGRFISVIVTKKAFLPGVMTPKSEITTARHALNKFSKDCERITIETADHVKLDTLLVNHPEESKKPIKDQKFIVSFNGNMGTYEGAVESLLKLSKQTGANVYTGNYRGIGLSEGFPLEMKDLVMDGEALIQYLLSLGVKSKNILIYGYSMGGAVGANVAALHQKKGDEINFISDRSFSTLLKETKEVFKDTGRDLLKSSFFLHRFYGVLILASIPFALGIIQAIGWNTNNLKCFKKIQGYKCIIYHRYDQVIPYAASLFKAYKNSEMTNVHKREKLARQAEKRRELNIKTQNKNKLVKEYHPKNFIQLIHSSAFDAHVIEIKDTGQHSEYLAHIKAALVT